MMTEDKAVENKRQALHVSNLRICDRRGERKTKYDQDAPAPVTAEESKMGDLLPESPALP